MVLKASQQLDTLSRNYFSVFNFVCNIFFKCLVNLDFYDNKIKFETNDYISSVTRQEDSQSSNHKNKIKSKPNENQ